MTILRRAEAGAIAIAVKATPKSSRNAILGAMDTATGRALKVAVTAAPDRGKANDAVIALVAKAFGVPKSAVSMIAGATGRGKLLRVAGDPKHLSQIAAQWNPE